MTTKPDLSSHIRKNKNLNKVVFPIFESCSKLTDDQLWIDIFTKFSKGKFLKGFTMQNGYLKYRKNLKFKQILIPDLPDQAMPVVKKFISENGSVFSALDKKIQDEFIESISFKKETNTFGELKKNKSLLNDYISCFIKEKGYDFKVMWYLLNFAFDYGIFNEKDIIIEENAIVTVNGIDVVDDEYSISEEKLKKIFTKKSSSTKTVKKTMEEMIWGKYVKAMAK